MISALLATACIWAARRMWAEEPRRLRIAALTLVGAWFGFWALLEISAYLGVPAALVLPLGALLLPFSVFFAIRDAVSAVGQHKVQPPLRAPATAEAILDAVDAVKAAALASA